MKLKLRFWSLAICCVLALQSGTLVSAASGSNYSETVFQLGDQTHEDKKMLRISARSNDVLDYFLTIEEENPKPLSVPKMIHYQSTNGGKKWSQADMSWMTTLKKKYPSGGRFSDAYVTDNGDLYCIVSIGQGEEEIGNTMYGFYDYKIFKISNKNLSEVPGITLGNRDSAPYSIGGFTKDGDIVILLSSYTDAATPSSVDTYDVKTGALKKHTELPIADFRYKYYNNSHAYKIEMHDGIFHLDEFDTQTGKMTRSVAIPDTGTMRASTVCGKKDGTIFVTSITGLYRLDPGKSEFVKLLDGASCKLGNNGWMDTAVCTEDGTIYAAIRNAGKTRNDPNYKKEGKIYRYSPK